MRNTGERSQNTPERWLIRRSISVYHIHVVQHAFLWVTGPRTSTFDYKKPEDFASPQL